MTDEELIRQLESLRSLMCLLLPEDLESTRSTKITNRHITQLTKSFPIEESLILLPTRFMGVVWPMA